VATLGAYTIALGVLVFIVNVIVSLRSGVVAGDDPWGSPGLEWATTSPPRPYNFVFPIVVRSLHPLWETTVEHPVITGLRTDRREVLVTSAIDAAPESRHHAPDPSGWPMYLAGCMAVLFIGSIFSPYYVLGALGLAAIGLLGWGMQSMKKIEPEIVELPGGALTEHA